MTARLLFCIADVPVETINSLLRTTQTNFYSLVKDPSQDSFDPRGTDPPVSEFINGFTGYSISQLQSFVTLRLSQVARKGFLEPDDFAVLDERSPRDNTVTIWMKLDQSLTKEPDPDDDYSPSGEGVEEWHSWRVRFEDAEQLAITVGMTLDSIPTFCREEFVGDDGIFDVKRAHRVFVKVEDS